MLAAGPGEQVDLGTGQVDRGGKHVEPGDARDGQGHLGDAPATDEHVVQRAVECVGVEAEREREAGLRIEVDDQGPPAQLGRGHAERVHGGGLRHSALLIGHRQDIGHAASLGPPVDRRLGRSAARTVARSRIRPLRSRRPPVRPPPMAHPTAVPSHRVPPAGVEPAT